MICRWRVSLMADTCSPSLCPGMRGMAIIATSPNSTFLATEGLLWAPLATSLLHSSIQWWPVASAVRPVTARPALGEGLGAALGKVGQFTIGTVVNRLH